MESMGAASPLPLRVNVRVNVRISGQLASNGHDNSSDHLGKTAVGLKRSRSFREAQVPDARKVSKQDSTSIQALPALKAEKPHEITPLTPKDLAGTILSRLHQLVSKEDQKKLDRVARDSSYREKLESFLKGGFNSEPYYQTDSCNTLYWGLMNRQLTPEAFLDYYTDLLIIIFFFSQDCEGTKPSSDEENLATGIKQIPLNEINLCDYFSEYKDAISAFIQSYPYSRNIFEIQLSSRAKALLLTKELPETNISTYIGKFWWLTLLDSMTPGIWITGGQDKIILGSFSLFQNAVKPKNEAGEEIMIKPTLSAGDWDVLKEIRSNDEHPMALWHPDIGDSLVNPDDMHAGSLALLHDFFHVNILNTVSKAKRQKFLQLDTDVVVPRIRFYKRLVSGKKVSEDKQFIQGFNTVYSRMYGREPGNWQDNIQQYYDNDVDVRDRFLVDQLNINEEKDDYSDSIDRWLAPSIREDADLPRRIIPQHLLIFQIVNSSNHKLAEEILGIEIKEYPDAVSKMTWDKSRETSEECIQRREKLLETHPKLFIQWEISHWINYLGRQHRYPLRSKK